MLLLNFAHPLTDDQLAQLTALLGEEPSMRDIPAQIDRSHPIAEVAVALAEGAQLSAREWQMLPLLINPPALAPLALALLGEIHGRRGDFPPFLNVRPVKGSVPTRYEISEIVNVQAIRNAARAKR